MGTAITNNHHLTTLSTRMLHGERRTITTPSGFRLSVPIRKVSSATQAIRQRSGVGLQRQAEALLNKGIGVRLPCARISLRFYGRHMTKSMLAAMVRLKRYHDRHPSEDFAHLNDFGGPRHGDWARLRWWGLIESRESTDDVDGRGWWRLTGLGLRWLRGAVKVPRTPALFDGAWVGWIDAADKIGPQDVDPEFDLDVVLLRRTR
jgi:hypothetical protein